MTDSEFPRLSPQEVPDRMSCLNTDWVLHESATAITRTIRCKGFAKAVYLANLAAFHADRLGHHPDVSFGFGYCKLCYTTHDVGGLSENDFRSAAAFDSLLD